MRRGRFQASAWLRLQTEQRRVPGGSSGCGFLFFPTGAAYSEATGTQLRPKCPKAVGGAAIRRPSSRGGGSRRQYLVRVPDEPHGHPDKSSAQQRQEAEQEDDAHLQIDGRPKGWTQSLPGSAHDD